MSDHQWVHVTPQLCFRLCCRATVMSLWTRFWCMLRRGRRWRWTDGSFLCGRTRMWVVRSVSWQSWDTCFNLLLTLPPLFLPPILPLPPSHTPSLLPSYHTPSSLPPPSSFSLRYMSQRVKKMFPCVSSTTISVSAQMPRWPLIFT